MWYWCCFWQVELIEVPDLGLLHNVLRYSVQQYSFRHRADLNWHYYGKSVLNIWTIFLPVLAIISHAMTVPSPLLSMKGMARLWLWLDLSTLCINSCHTFALGLDQAVSRGLERGGNWWGGATDFLLFFQLSLGFLRTFLVCQSSLFC